MTDHHATIGPIIDCQNPPNDVLVDLDAEGFSQLLGDPGAAETRIALLKFNDGSDQFRGWSLGIRLALPGSGIEPPVLVSPEGRMKLEQGRGFENHRAAQNPARIQKQGPVSQEQPLRGAEVGRSLPRTIDNQQLVLEQETFRHDPFNPAGAKQPRQRGH